MKWLVRSGELSECVHADSPAQAICLAMRHVRSGMSVALIVGAIPDGGKVDDEVYMLTSKAMDLIGDPIPEDVLDAAWAAEYGDEAISF